MPTYSVIWNLALILNTTISGKYKLIIITQIKFTIEKYANLADCKDIFDNEGDLSWKTKLLYKGINNKFFQLILKLIPGKIIKNMVDKNGINYYDTAYPYHNGQS